MKKCIAILLFFYAFGNILYAQGDNTTYILKGTINMDTGRISLIPVGGKEYYPDTSDFKEVIIGHGEFTFTGTVPYPLGVRLFSRAGEGYVTRTFYIEPGTQTVICNKDSVREVPKIINESMKEVKGSLHDAYSNYNLKYYKLHGEWDSLWSVYNKNVPNDVKNKWTVESNELNKEYNKVLVAYAKKHPDSYVVLWQLVGSLAISYSPIYDTVYAQLSSKIRHTYTGNVLKRELDAAKNTDVGGVFPQLTLFDTSHVAKQLKLADGVYRYTLIDFWFSHCSPCLRQFPKYKKIYATYKTKGLEIIGISVDKTTAIGDWKKVINDKDLPWPQYLDENGILAAGLVINSFPRNFLLDEHNVIIKKDITPEQLEQILAK